MHPDPFLCLSMIPFYRLVREVDQFLTKRIGGESFVTAFFALYDERDVSLFTIDCGHGHVLSYLAASGKAVPPRWVGERYLPLMASQYVSANGANGHEPRPWPLRIGPGDTLVIYTDGLVEARRGKEEYGMRRLRETVAELGGRRGPDPVCTCGRKPFVPERRVR